ncbi:MAG: hypothetical protein MZV64_57440 [Ignavibacteriales bacterium]|nr:hypothetical protein [Ignavibacteriales bacterium]
MFMPCTIRLITKCLSALAKNLPAVIRRFEFTLQMESFPYQDLIDDFKKLGKENFEVKILDELELKNETEKEIAAELN